MKNTKSEFKHDGNLSGTLHHTTCFGQEDVFNLWTLWLEPKHKIVRIIYVHNIDINIFYLKCTLFWLHLWTCHDILRIWCWLWLYFWTLFHDIKYILGYEYANKLINMHKMFSKSCIMFIVINGCCRPKHYSDGLPVKA